MKPLLVQPNVTRNPPTNHPFHDRRFHGIDRLDPRPDGDYQIKPHKLANCTSALVPPIPTFADGGHLTSSSRCRDALAPVLKMPKGDPFGLRWYRKNRWL